MRVLRGRATTPDDDAETTTAMLERTGESGDPTVRVWRPHRQVAFGRRDANAEGYERARRAARERGYESVERSVGGRAVAYTGTTLAVAHAVPVEDLRRGLHDRYDAASATLREALSDLGVDAVPGEPDDSFCPGTHSLRADGKIVGIAQRVRQSAALVAGVVIVADREEVAAVLQDVYGALDVPFDSDSVGSVKRAGGPADPDAVTRAIEDAIVGDRERIVERVD
jgi:lipoate-protein ligase A